MNATCRHHRKSEELVMENALEGLAWLAVATALAYLSIKAARTAAAMLGVPPTVASGAVSLAAHAIR
jgi:hypothetical protein